MPRHLLSRPFLTAPHPSYNSSQRLGLQIGRLYSAPGYRPCSTQAVAVGATASGKVQVPVSGPVSLPVSEPDWTQRPPIAGRPLSTLPNGALLRSLLIVTVSSKPFLLRSTLNTLSFLVKSKSKFLFNVDKNPVLYTILKKTFYDHFCTGENAEEVRACVKKLRAMGMRGVILTYAKETLFDHFHQPASGQVIGQVESHDQAVEDWRSGVMNTLGMVGPGDYLAIKLTGAGQGVTRALYQGNMPSQQMMNALHEIASTSKDRGVKVIVDAESQYFQKAIDNVAVELMRKYNRDGYAAVYNTYQAYLKGTAQNIANHLSEAKKDGFTFGLKLVRGAYISSEKRSLIHDTKQDTDNGYDAIIHGAIRRQFGGFGGDKEPAFPSVDLFLASHNKKSLLSALRLHRQMTKAGLPTVPISFGQLHGMSDELSFSLVHEAEEGEAGPAVYKCSTWGTMGECLAYMMRRAAENRDAVLRTTDEYAAVKQECWKRLRRTFSTAS